MARSNYKKHILAIHVSQSRVLVPPGEGSNLWLQVQRLGGAEGTHCRGSAWGKASRPGVPTTLPRHEVPCAPLPSPLDLSVESSSSTLSWPCGQAGKPGGGE